MAGSTHDHPEVAAPTRDAPGRAGALGLERPVATSTRHDPPGHVERHASDATPVDLAPRRDRLSRRRTLALQRSAGNRAVSGLLRHIQRVPVTEPKQSETLYNDENAAGQATANSYSMTAKYEMTRSGDSSATVTVKIRFVSQSRNTIDPASPTAPAGTPRLGALIGSPTEIPADDPRRAWATTVVQEGVKIWNGRLTFVGEEERPAPPDPVAGVPPPTVTKKRLPVAFRAEPVFGLGDAAHSQVVVHPPSTVAGTPGHPIDAGNYYMDKGTYSGDDKVITAHEYGHLLGIPDEYSQSNEQINALIHQAAPGNAPSVGKALDKETVKRMVLVSLREPMYWKLDAALPRVAAALGTQRAQVTRRLRDAAKTAVVSADVVTQLTGQLEGRAAGQVKPDVPGAVAFQTTRNFSGAGYAGSAVTAAFSTAGLSTQIGDAYWKALSDAAGRSVAVAGLGDVSIDVHGAVGATTASGGANAAAAQGLATSSVGPAPAPAGGGAAAGGTTTGGGTPGLPAITPPAALVDKLTALPSTWGAAGSAVETGITEGRFAAKMVGTLKTAQIVAAVASMLPGGIPQTIGTTGKLYREAYSLVSNAARTAARELMTELISSTMDPLLQSNVTDLQAAISTEVERIMGTPASGVAALGTPDPNMTALVNAMKTRLDADKAATAGGGRDPLGKTGGTAPAQDVTYSYQGLMGSSATTALRPDQFTPMVKQFNDNLKTEFEKPFAAEAT